MRMQNTVLASIVCAGLCAATASAVPIFSPGFEENVAPGVFAGWENFGPNVYREALFARTGTRTCKMFQNFSGAENYTGVAQGFDAAEGDVLVGTIYAQHVAGDTLRGLNRCVLKFDYFDAAGNYTVSSPEVLMIDALTPTNFENIAPQFTVTHTAPPNTARAKLAVVFVGDNVFSGGAAWLDDAAVTKNGVAVPLTNPSFEDSGGANWIYFNAAGRTNTGVARSGTWCLNTNGVPGAGFSANGAFQALPVTAGRTYKLAAYAAQSDLFGAITGFADRAVLNIEWFNAGGAQMSFISSTAADSTTPLNEYRLIETIGEAPAGAVSCRIVCLNLRFAPADGGSATPGTVFWDDITFDDVTAAPTCLADVVADGSVDGGDFIAFINSFAIGDANVDPTADVIVDGTIDGTDFIEFINAFSAGC